MLNFDPNKIRGDVVWHKVPLSQLVGKRNETLIKSIVSYYLDKTGKSIETKKLTYILSDKNEIANLASFFTTRSRIEKNKKLTFEALSGLGELYSKYSFYENAIPVWKTASLFAPSIAKKKVIRKRLVEDIQKLVMNLVSAKKIKSAVNVIFEHILYITSNARHRISEEEHGEIRSLLISPHIAQKILIKVNKIATKRKNSAMNAVIKIIKDGTF